MGGVESNDKERDMTIPDHMAQNFRQSQYYNSGYPSSDVDDGRYGACKIIEAAYDSQIVQKRIRVKDERQFTTYLNNKQQRMNFNPNWFVKLIDYDSGAMPAEESEDNTYKYFIDCYFEHHPNDLRQEIAERRSNGYHFSAEELDSFMDMFINAGVVLENVGSRHGDIRPEFVCLDSQGKPLLMDNIRDKAGTGGRLALVTEIEIYLSPILFKCFSRNVVKYKHDKPKDDVFAAGMVLLEAGILDSVQGCYDIENCKFNVEHLNELIERFEQVYAGNNNLCQRLRRFLVVDEVDRCRFKEMAGQSGKAQPAQTQNTGYGNQQSSTNYSTGYNNGYSNQKQHGGGYQSPGYGHTSQGYGSSGQNNYTPQQSYQPAQQSYGGYGSGYSSSYGTPQKQQASQSPPLNPLASRLVNYK